MHGCGHACATRQAALTFIRTFKIRRFYILFHTKSMTEPISTQCAWTDSNQIGSDNYSPGGSLVPGSSESKESSPYSYQPARSSLRVVEPTLSKAAHKVFAHKLPTKVHFRNKEAQQREENVRVSISCKGVLKATSNKEGSPAVVVTSLLAHKHFLSHCWRNVDLKHRKNDMFSNLTEKGCVFWADFLDLQEEGAVEWRKEIEEAIRGCNKFVAFIDLQYLLSFNCIEEMACAIHEHKPLVLSILDQGAWDLLTGHGGAQKAWNAQPAVGMPLSSFEGKPVGPNRAPFSLEMLEQMLSALASVNFCPCRDLDIQLQGKARIYERLHRFIDKDLEYSKEFADLKQRAEVWEDAGRPAGLLLPKKQATQWVQWIAIADKAEAQPAPTWAQREYVMFSKKRARQQAKLLSAALIVALVLILASAVAAMVMAIRAESQRRVAEDQRTIAEQRRAEAEYQGAVASTLLLSADRMPYTTAGIRAQAKAADLAESNRIPEVVLPALHDTVKYLVAKPYQFLDLEGHRAQINSADFSPSGSSLLSSSKDGKIIVWPITWDPPALVPELVEPAVLSGDWGTDHCVIARWIADDTFAAAFDGGGFQVWQKQADGGWRAELVATPHKKKILTMAVSRDGSMVATGVKGMTVALWSFNEDTPLNELSEQTFSTPERPLSMVFSPDGRYLTFGYPKGVLAYCDVREESGTVEHDEIFDLMELPSPENVGALAFSPDGRWLAAGLADGTVHLIGWNETNVSTSRVIYSITSPAPTASSFQAVVGLAWSSETTLIVAVDVGTVSIWEISEGDDEGEADSKPVLQSQLVYKTSTSATSAPIPATGVAFSGKIGGGTIALSSEESMLRLWFPTPQLRQHAPLGFRMQITPDYPSEITVMAWSRTRMAACSAEGDIAIWELIPATGHWRRAAAFPVFDGSMADDGQCRSLAWAPDESMVAAGTKRSTIEVWQRQQDGEWVHVMHGAAAGDVRKNPSFSPDSRWLAVPGKGSPEIWLFHVPFHALPGTKDEVLTQPDHVLKHEEGEIKSVAWARFSPSKAADLLLASSGEDSTRLWDLSDVSSEDSPGLSVQGTTILADLGFQYATQMDWSAAGRLFAMSHEGIGQVWHWKHDGVTSDGGAWAALMPVEGHTGILGSVSWSPDGSQLVVPFDDNSLRIYDMDGEAERAEVLYQIQHKCRWLMWIPVSLENDTEAARIACANSVCAAAVEGEKCDFAFDMLLVDFEEQQRLLKRMTYGRLTDRDLQILRLERLEAQVLLPKLTDSPDAITSTVDASPTVNTMNNP